MAIFDPDIFDPAIFGADEQTTPIGFRKNKTMNINRAFTHATLAVPSSSTTLTALLANSNVTLPSGVISLSLQARGSGGVCVEFDGSNATTDSYLISDTFSIEINRANLNIAFPSIAVIQGSGAVNLRVDAFA